MKLSEMTKKTFIKRTKAKGKIAFFSHKSPEELEKYIKKMHEKLILQVQRLANTYYHSIWNNCSNIEKLLIFDLAEDGLLNSTDTQPLKNLYHKGIMNFDKAGRPSLFNESFRNFVLESSRIEEAKILEKEYKKRGEWDTYRIVLITIIISLLMFFVLANRQFLDQFNTMFSIVISVIPALFKASQGLLSLPFLKNT